MKWTSIEGRFCNLHTVAKNPGPASEMVRYSIVETAGLAHRLKVARHVGFDKPPLLVGTVDFSKPDEAKALAEADFLDFKKEDGTVV